MNIHPDPSASPLAPRDWLIRFEFERTRAVKHCIGIVTQGVVARCRLSVEFDGIDEQSVRKEVAEKARSWIADYLCSCREGFGQQLETSADLPQAHKKSTLLIIKSSCTLLAPDFPRFYTQAQVAVEEHLHTGTTFVAAHEELVRCAFVAEVRPLARELIELNSVAIPIFEEHPDGTLEQLEDGQTEELRNGITQCRAKIAQVCFQYYGENFPIFGITATVG